MRRRTAVHLDRMVDAEMSGASATQGPVRMSTAARLLREKGNEAGASELERDAKIAAPWCQRCERAIPDPVIGILGSRVTFACPHCSDPRILQRWLAEAP